MYNHQKTQPTKLRVNNTVQGEHLHVKIKRFIYNKEPITDQAPLIYTERNQGVMPAYDIRADKMEIAAEAMDVASKAYLAKREDRHNPKKKEEKKETPEGEKSGDLSQ